MLFRGHFKTYGLMYEIEYKLDPHGDVRISCPEIKYICSSSDVSSYQHQIQDHIRLRGCSYVLVQPISHALSSTIIW